MNGTIFSPSFHDWPAARNRLRRALVFALPYRKAIGLVALITLLTAAFNALEPLLLKYLFDDLLGQQRLRVLWLGLGGLCFVGLFRELTSSLANWLSWKTRISIHYALLEAMVAQLHRLPLSFHRREGVGAITTKLDRSIQGFLAALSSILGSALPSLLYLSLSISLMIRLNGSMAVLVLCLAPLPAIVAALASPEQTRRERALFDRYVHIYGRFHEVLAGLLTVRSFAMEEKEKRRFLEEVGQANEVVVRGVGRDSMIGAISNSLVLCARLGSIGLGAFLMLRGEVSVGTVLAFLGYLGGFFGPVQGLSALYQGLQRASVSLEEIFSILDEKVPCADGPNARALGAVRGEIEFEGVHFAYEPGGLPVLEGINLQVAAGETVALVGPSGAGKSTLTALLMRFYDPSAGVVRLDGIDLRELNVCSLRRQIGVVLQEPLLFNDSVRNNIAYGCEEATLEEIVAAAEAANAHEFIRRLPQGYETVLGERGGRLSAGERQRLTIARALVKAPPVMVLDEATSSLDAESEALVQEALLRLIRRQTTLVIAHRLATVVHADRIIVLQHGRIGEIGTHQELMRANGYYASLVRRQTHGLIFNEGEEAP